ncbi:MAG: tyrosine-type recombinase/integrase [bacterium]|nr:tyrosine-type recombinase/integrase [bacterium]
MKHYRIDNAVRDLVSVFIESGYTSKTIAEHKRNIQKVVNIHHEQGEYFYNPQIVDHYVFQLKEMYDLGTISRSRKNALIKAALYVREIATTGIIAVGVKNIQDKLSLYYRKILETIKLSNDWSEALKRNIVYAAHTYFLFLMDSGIRDIREISEETVWCYVIQKVSTVAPNSLNTIRRNLKHLHLWLYKNGYTQSDFSSVLSFTTPSVSHIEKPVPLDEVTLMFQAIDKETAIGKRNYAMLMIAVVTGMRSIDIAALKFSDIDWINGEIRISQKKTDITLALPLTADVGEALKDYILHGRPESKYTNIFLTSRPPRAIYGAFNRARSIAGLKKCSFHGLRRTVGTNMIIAGIPITTVAQVLGHSEISSTKQYISLDSVHLKECTLGLEGIAMKGDKV